MLRVPTELWGSGGPAPSLEDILGILDSIETVVKDWGKESQEAMPALHVLHHRYNCCVLSVISRAGWCCLK